jgi:predicted GH43/DUF377 family glycosyl hydrolase
MKLKIHPGSIALILMTILNCTGNQPHGNEFSDSPEQWPIMPFYRVDSMNPVLLPSGKAEFYDSILQQSVRWEEKDVFNPAAVVRDGKVFLLYRAEDDIGIYKGTSRIGMAVSADGLHFDKFPQPVFYPGGDAMKMYEWPGGCEDPRIVSSAEGKYIMTYTAWDGKTARLCIAASSDLVHWEKIGLAFRDAFKGRFNDTWTKSGSIVCRQNGDSVLAEKINGKYWMYFGDTDIFLAQSDDLLSWEPITGPSGNPEPVLRPRKGYFDSQLVEPGPPAILTSHGIVLIYNGMNSSEYGDNNIPAGTYSAGQALFDRSDPSKCINRLEESFFFPEKDYEITGQINRVCFLEGMVFFKGRVFLYYGTADSKVAVAVM